MSTSNEAAGRVEWFAERFAALQQNVETFIRGKSGVVRMALVCMMGEGHLLIDDVPGVGKTSLAKVIAESMGGSMSRIQFTPDLLPTDVTGVRVYHQDSHDFVFHPGAVFANIVVGDEINRASPKTQSALLEVMEERQVTIDGEPHFVPSPFMVIATQNPVELDGTYHLPEAQIDRFMMRLSIGYPDHQAEVEVLANRVKGMRADDTTAVMSIEHCREMVEISGETYVSPAINSYVVTIAAATRKMPELRLGVSPRGSLALVVAAQAMAASEARTFVTADDIKALAPYVFSHRMLLTPEAELQGATPEDLLAGITSTVPVPQERVEATT